jgi:hypothetical protein
LEKYDFGIFGSISRELYYKIEKLNGKARALIKVIILPLLIILAYLDTKIFNPEHQGFMFKVTK